MKKIQEKSQIIAKGKTNGGKEWDSVQSTRRSHPQEYLCLPTEELQEPVVNSMPLSLAGSTDVTDTVNTPDLNRGYAKSPMSPVEDMYTNEHQDTFYGDVGGFCERNNYLDRN